MMCARIPLFLLAAMLLAIGSPVSAQTAPAGEATYYLRQDGTEPLGTDANGRGRARLWFRAYKDSTFTEKYTGRLGNRYQDMILVNNQKIQAVSEPVAADADTVRVAFLLALDVSTSMGPASPDANAYDRRMRAVRGALEGFFTAYEGRPHVYFRLMPFGQDVEMDVSVPGKETSQRVDRWKGRYLSLSNPSDFNDILSAIEDIDFFVLNQTRQTSVGTALYGAINQGIAELNNLSDRDEWVGAKKILIVLTDGNNDLRAFPDSPFRRLTLRDVEDRLSERVRPGVHIIGFGTDRVLERDMEALAGHENTDFRPVTGDQRGQAELRQTFDSIYEVHASQYSIDFILPNSDSPDYFVSIDNRVERAEKVALRSMLLLPSALNVQNIKVRLITFGIAALLLLILFNVWYYFRPREEEFDDDDESRDSGLGEQEALSDMRQRGLSVQEYQRRRAAKGAGLPDEN